MPNLHGKEREALKTARRRIRQIHEAGSDSRRREITTDALCEIDDALAAREEPPGHLAEECCPDECPACAEENTRATRRTAADDVADLQACAEEVRDVFADEDTERPDAPR